MFVYFQDKLGGEIGLSKTAASPELSFDVTVVELTAGPVAEGPPGLEQPGIRIGKYGVIELQTTDTHGSYQHAVTALTNALDLHAAGFPEVLAANPEWAGRRIEGPNISNVVKRTFYQIAFKFQVTKRETSACCALALPQPVWDSWQPFLGAPAAPHSKSRQLEPLSTEETPTPPPRQSHAASAATYPKSADNPDHEETPRQRQCHSGALEGSHAARSRAASGRAGCPPGTANYHAAGCRDNARPGRGSDRGVARLTAGQGGG